MQLVPIDSIGIAPNRQRRDFDPMKLQQLAESILDNQLMQPLVVRGDDGRLVLVAGERRLRAIKDYIWELGGTFKHHNESVPLGMVPIVHLGELPYALARRAELEENVRRVDLTWQEKALAQAELVELIQGYAVEQGESPPSLAEIAEETVVPLRAGFEGDPAWAAGQVRRQVIVSKHLDNPEVARAKNLEDAYKALKRAEETKRNEELARVVGASLSRNDHSLLRGDCLEVMKEWTERFDVICTDPPYGIRADDFGDAGGRLQRQVHNYGDAPEEYLTLMETFAPLTYQVAKPQAHLYLCCDIDWFIILRSLFDQAGWWVHRTPIINYKIDGNRVPWPEHGPQRKWELVLYAVKGKKPTVRIYPDVIHTRGDENLGHGAQKPVELYVDLLRRSVKAGDAVLDPFSGTGTIFPAAHQLLCRATGIELEEAAFGIAAKRLEEL